MTWFPPWAAWSLAGGEDKHTRDKCHEVTNKGIHTYRCTPKRKKKQTGEVTQPPRVRLIPGPRARGPDGTGRHRGQRVCVEEATEL